MTGSVKRKAYHRGIAAEHFAAIFLRFKGYRILERRFKTPVGEIDLIVCRRNTLVFVEVKERAVMRTALECLSPAMRGRITRAAQYYLAGHPAVAGMDMRFDLIATSGFSIQHLDNAWSAAA